MSFRLKVRPEVDLDIEDAAGWYDSRQPGLGAEFARATRDRIQEILRDPELPRIRDRTRQARWVFLSRFPYRIIYRVRGDTVIIYSVLHAARHDRHWKQRT